MTKRNKRLIRQSFRQSARRALAEAQRRLIEKEGQITQLLESATAWERYGTEAGTELSVLYSIMQQLVPSLLLKDVRDEVDQKRRRIHINKRE